MELTEQSRESLILMKTIPMWQGKSVKLLEEDTEDSLTSFSSAGTAENRSRESLRKTMPSQINRQ